MNEERFVDELFSLISVERNRRVLARCASGSRTTATLKEDLLAGSTKREKDTRGRTLEKDLGRMRVLGLLDGAKSPGWVLVASEVLDLIAAIRRAHVSERLFVDLANRTFRRVLTAMLGPERTRTELGRYGPAVEVTNALTDLERYCIITCVDRKAKCWRVNAHTEPWIEVIGRGQMLVHALLHEPATRAVNQGAATMSDPGSVVPTSWWRTVTTSRTDC